MCNCKIGFSISSKIKEMKLTLKINKIKEVPVMIPAVAQLGTSRSKTYETSFIDGLIGKK